MNRLESARLVLARTALEAALATKGVAGANAGLANRYVTSDGDERLAGVIAAAAADGRYDVDLFLTATLAPLHDTADRVRERTRSAVKRAGLADRLGRVSVSFLDVADAP